MTSVPLHGMRYPDIKEDGTPTGQFNTTKEQFDNHTKFIQSAGFLCSDEETVHNPCIWSDLLGYEMIS